MNYLKNIQAKLKQAQLSVDDLIANTVDKNEDQIRKWIRESWLTGYDSNNDAIGLYRFEDYAEEKNAMNSLAGFGNVDLTYSGAMGRAIQIKGLNNNEFEVFSTVSYYDKILEKYGDASFNIREFQKEKLIDLMLKAIFSEINKAYA